MSTIQQVYTSIPDTSDNEYWEAKPYDNRNRTRVFVPRNKELHQQLKAKAWEAIQQRHGAVKRERDFSYKLSPTGTLPASTGLIRTA
jgi:hypothetical protein